MLWNSKLKEAQNHAMVGELLIYFCNARVPAVLKQQWEFSHVDEAYGVKGNFCQWNYSSASYA